MDNMNLFSIKASEWAWLTVPLVIQIVEGPQSAGRGNGGSGGSTIPIFGQRPQVQTVLMGGASLCVKIRADKGENRASVRTKIELAYQKAGSTRTVPVGGAPDPMSDIKHLHRTLVAEYPGEQVVTVGWVGDIRNPDSLIQVRVFTSGTGEDEKREDEAPEKGH